jgi:hypothetical protein
LWFPIVRATIAVALGVALTALYLIPAAWEQRWVDIQQATGVNGDPGLRVENNWIFPHHADAALHLRDQTLHLISPIAVSMIAVALLGLLVLWLRGRLSADAEGAGTANEPLARRWSIPLAFIPVAVLFLLTPVSMPVWNLLPKLRFLQFPWRWLLVVEAPMGIFFAAAVWPGEIARRWFRPAVACVCALIFAGTTIFAAQNFFRDDVEYGDFDTTLANYTSGLGFIGTDEYAPPGADNSVVAMGLPDACLADDFDTELGIAATPDDTPMWRAEQGTCNATAADQTHRPEQMRIEMTASRAGFLILHLRSFPAWRVRLNGQVATNLPARVDGLIAVPVTQGPVELTVDWVTTPDVTAGRCVSVLALLLLTALGLLERKLSRTQRA